MENTSELKQVEQVADAKLELAAWVLMGLALIVVLKVHLLPALIAGLLVFELVHIIAPHIAKKLPGKTSKLLAVGLLAIAVVGLLTLAVMGLLAFFRSDVGSLHLLLGKMAEIIEDSRKILPVWIDDHLPEDAITLQQIVTAWLREHADELQFAGQEFGRALAQIIIGMIIGGMVSLREATLRERYKPLAKAMATRVELLGSAFKNIVFAQVKISAINATFTGLYLAVILPLMGVHLPLTKTMIAITFIVGLMPVIGNLVSNTIIVVVSMSQSLGVAIGSLIFLIVIHKLEYFLNAKIVGGQIRAKAWELLVAMLAMEATFGIAGVIAAPIYYAYIKSELMKKQLV